MAKRTSYEPGTFSWVELSTDDPDAAKEFYGGLFGWEADDLPVPGGGTYTMLNLDGVRAAALQRKPPQQEALPPYWFSYITVASADDAAAAAKAAGGNVHMDPFDVMESGRMTVIMDPTGAAFGVWEPNQHIGAQVVNEPGSLTWNELSSSDVPAAISFYEEVFGWKVQQLDTGDFPDYWSIGHDGAAGGRNGGMRELPPEHQQEGVPSNWMPYFAVADVTDALATAESAGGTKLFGPLDVPQGRFVIVRDPQGAIFGIVAGESDG